MDERCWPLPHFLQKAKDVSLADPSAVDEENQEILTMSNQDQHIFWGLGAVAMKRPVIRSPPFLLKVLTGFPPFSSPFCSLAAFEVPSQSCLTMTQLVLSQKYFCLCPSFQWLKVSIPCRKDTQVISLLRSHFFLSGGPHYESLSPLRHLHNSDPQEGVRECPAFSVSFLDCLGHWPPYLSPCLLSLSLNSASAGTIPGGYSHGLRWQSFSSILRPVPHWHCAFWWWPCLAWSPDK